jgi:formylglycine-generating enzyme required for sulfatase activity
MDIEVTEALDTSGLYPVISQHPDIAPAGSKFLQRGKGFSPNSRVTIHVRRPDGSVYTPEPVYTDHGGHFAVEFTTSPDRDPGPYTWWAEDITGLKSSELTYTVSVPGNAAELKIFQEPDSGTIGTRFFQWGSGFTPNSTATIWVRSPGGNEEAAETVHTDGHGGFSTVYRVSEGKPAGVYAWWAINDSTGSRSGEKTYAIGTSGRPGRASAAPSSGSWESSPRLIQVSCPNAERIYCNHNETYDGSDPAIPEPPTMEIHDIFNQEEVEFIGPEGQFEIWAEPGQHKILKVVFRGWNGNGWGQVSEVFTYEIDRRDEGLDSFTNSLGMTFVRIPAGTFTMGSPTDEPGRGGDETQHQVTLTRDYYIMTTEVTQAQWEAVMGSNPSHFDTCGGDCPVESVSWNDIQDFIAAFNAMEGKAYRLPTEAEWEHAARAGTATAFYNGGITNSACTPLDPNLDQIGWYCGNSGVDGIATYHPVAQKQPNAFGLYDMSGNVWEWCQDWYGSYPDGAVTDPTDPETGADRVLRGGSWLNNARNCRSAVRSGISPSYRSNYAGFRLALSPGR